jgi:hypothetical protein
VRALVAAALGALALSGGAAGAIVPQQGMAGIRLGMSQAQVRAVLGEPLRVLRGTNDFGPYTELRYPFRLRVAFQGNESVTAIETKGHRERTRRGVGVGSTEAQVEAGVPRVRCETFPGGYRTCYVGSYEPGMRVTDFQIRDGRVVRVVVALVID